MVRRGSASKCDIGWRRKPYSFSRRSAKILAISLCFDFSEGTLRTSSNLRIGKGRTALGESPLQVRMTALRKQSPLRVRIQFPPPHSLACFPTLWRSDEIGAWGAIHARPWTRRAHSDSSKRDWRGCYQHSRRSALANSSPWVVACRSHADRDGPFDCGPAHR